MAHDCPECWSQCHCGGDIDDINFGEGEHCRHFLRLECSGHREYCDDPKCPCSTWPEDDDDFLIAE